VTDNISPDVGYGTPPKHTQFQKGQSGNPKGRPKGSKNVATLLEAVGRESIIVNENGRRRRITKKQAALTQLVNKSASGDLKALHLYTHLTVMCESSDQPSKLSVPDERDRSVMANILKRIQQAESTNAADPSAVGSSPKKEEK
jgi:hypothetical protein